MITLEKLTTGTLKLIKALIEDKNNKRDYKLNFIEMYNKKNKLMQFFYRKNVYLIKYDTSYVGYIWTDIPGIDSIKILDFYIMLEYIDKLDDTLFSKFNKSRVYFECLESNENSEVFQKLSMKKCNVTKLFSLKVEDVIIKNRVTRATFRNYKCIDDAPKRCHIQNQVFNTTDRVPLITEDILNEEKQDYFLNDLCVFVKVNDMEVGYGQIIYNRGVHTIVNFGLLEEYRNMGYGADLLLVLIELSKIRGVEKLYIRVDEKNKQAMDLYKNIGFSDIGDYCVWTYKLLREREEVEEITENIKDDLENEIEDDIENVDESCDSDGYNL